MPQHNSKSFRDQVFSPYRDQPDPRGERINNLEQTGMSWRARYTYSCSNCGLEWTGYGELRPLCPNCD